MHLGQPKLPHCFFRIEVHLVARHPHPCDRRFRGGASDPRDHLVNLRCRPRHRVGNTNLRGRNPGEFFENGERLLHGPIAVPISQDIPFSDSPLFSGEHMPCRDITDVDPIQSGIQIGRHRAIQKVHDHLPRRRRFHIPRSNRSTGIHHHHRQTIQLVILQ